MVELVDTLHLGCSALRMGVQVSLPVPYAVVAQMVERSVEARMVVSSILTRSTIWTNSTMVSASVS